MHNNTKLEGYFWAICATIFALKHLTWELYIENGVHVRLSDFKDVYLGPTFFAELP